MGNRQMAEIVNLNDRRPPGNGAREALIATLKVHGRMLLLSDENATDIILSSLWLHGFKVVPFDRSDDR